ncbi:MAG TPA: RDD family protein [Thermoanaerobaculia bacterium]|jgi:uncharacterized RDD family membrane protein YckC
MEAAVPAASQVRTAYAGFWIRVLATILDGLILSAAGWVLGRGFPANAYEASGVVTLVLGWLYSAFLESGPKQGTVGKMALGLIVTDEQGRRIDFGRATIRHFSKFLSAIILLIGFVMVAFDPRKQGLHDKIAKTFVLKVGP